MRAHGTHRWEQLVASFPFLFGGAFIEGGYKLDSKAKDFDFPSFSEGLSLRGSDGPYPVEGYGAISLPFRRGFH